LYERTYTVVIISGICRQTLSSVSSAEAKSWQPEIKDEGAVVTVVT